MHVLHLIDPGSPGGGACTLRLMAAPVQRLTSVRHRVIIVGTERHLRLAEHCGVEADGVLPAPARIPVFGYRSLRRLIREYERAHGPIDLIHAWTARAAMLAIAAAPQIPRIATLAIGPVNGMLMHGLAAMLEHHPTPMLASSSAVAREYQTMGVDADHLTVLRPAVNPELIRMEERDQVRRELGVDGDTLVVGLLAEPSDWADGRQAAAVITPAIAARRKVKLLMHPRTTRHVEAKRWVQTAGWRESLILDERTTAPWRIVHAIDAALLIGGEMNAVDMSGAASPFSLLLGGGSRLRPMPGVMPLLWAMAAGLPVIAEASDAVRDIVIDGRTGLLVPPRDAAAATDRIIRLHDDRTIGGRLGAAGKQLVHDAYHVAAYCVRLKEAYERAIHDESLARPLDEPSVQLVSP